MEERKHQALPDDQFGNGMYSRTEASDRKVVDRLGRSLNIAVCPTRRSAGLDAQQTVHHRTDRWGTKPHHLADALAPFPCASPQMRSPRWRNSTSRIRSSALAEAVLPLISEEG